MSIRAMTWALDHAPEELSCAERFVLVALADHVDDETRKAWPSVDRLAHRTALNRRTVQRALRTLETHGIITHAHQQGPIRNDRSDRRPNLYLWHPERATGDPAGPVENSADGASPDRPVPSEHTERGGLDDTTGRSDAALTVIEPSDKPSVVEVVGNCPPSTGPQVDPVEEAARSWWAQVDTDHTGPDVDPSPVTHHTDTPAPALHVRDHADRARRALRAGIDRKTEPTGGETP